MRSRCSGSGFAQLAPHFLTRPSTFRRDVQSLPRCRGSNDREKGEKRSFKNRRVPTGVWEREGKIEESGEDYVQISRRDPSLRAGLAYRSG
jgi:hypothetical protein